MSLEAAIQENTAAIKELVAATAGLTALRADAIEKVTAAAAPAKKAAAEKPAAEKKSEEKPAAEKPAASDGPTVEDVNAAIKKYVGGTDREEERSARAAKVKGVLTKYSPEGTEKPNGATLAEDKRGAFIKTVDQWIKDGDLTAPPTAADDADALLDD